MSPCATQPYRQSFAPNTYRSQARLIRRILLPCAAVFLTSCGTLFNTKPPIDIDINENDDLFHEASNAAPIVEETQTKPFDEASLYALLTAEIALSREHYEIGLENYMAQAASTKDINIISRATQVADILNRHPETLELAELWVTEAPSDSDARLILLSEYITAQRYSEAFDQALFLLEKTGGKGVGFEDIAIDAAKTRFTGTAPLLEKYRTLITHHPRNGEVLVGLSVLEQEEEHLEPALKSARDARHFAPKNTRAIYQEYRVLYELKRFEQATKVFGQFVEEQPENLKARSQYANMLLNYDLDEALKQIREVARHAPDEPNNLLSLGLILAEKGEYQEAQTHLEKLLQLKQHEDLSHYHLGEIARAEDRPKQALQHFIEVRKGSRLIDAVSKAADIINKSKGFKSALIFVQARREQTDSPQDKQSLYRLEADTLQSAGLNTLAKNILDMALQEFPDNLSLRYSRAMLYASQRETAAAEADFLKVLEKHPDSAFTLNALGYTLLDQTKRTKEASTYIRKAYAIESNDPAILDSLGWLEYKLGNLQKAQAHLEAALKQVMDDEIAAHLGEVLWQRGRKSSAKKIWQRGLEHTPKSDVIEKTLKRLGANL